MTMRWGHPFKRAGGRFAAADSYTLVEVMVATSVATVVIAAGMLIFIMLYRMAADTSRQIRVQRKADLLIERIARGPFGGYGGLRGAYVNSSLVGNQLPNPVGGSVNATPASNNNYYQSLTYYAQINFSNFVSMSAAVGSSNAFANSYLTPGVAAKYQIGYNSTSNFVYYRYNDGPQTAIIDLEDVELSYLRFSGGLFQRNITSTFTATNTFMGTNYFTNYPSNLILVEFGMPYLTADGRRTITNNFSFKVYLRNNF